MPCTSQGRGVSHPVGTLRRWSSSHHARCSGRRRRVPRRGSWHRRRGPGAAARRRGRTPALRPRPGRRAAGLARGRRLRRRRGAGRPRAAPLPRAAPAARVPRRAARRRRPRPTGSSCSRLVHALLRQLVTRRRDRRPVGATRSTHCGPPERDAVRATTSSRCRTPARSALSETLAAHARNLSALVPRFAPGWMPRTDDRVAIPLGRRPGGPARGLRPARGPAPAAHGLAVRARPVHGRTLGVGSGGHCTTCPCSRPCAAARPRSAWRCSSRRPAATASRTCARSISGRIASHIAAVARRARSARR